MAASTSTSLSVAVAHAISFLTRPLMATYPASTIIKLQYLLEANLTALYAPTWVTSDPLRGSGRRCLTLSPDCLPPRVIYAACLATGIQWFDWVAALGGAEFDFFVDPSCVAVRYGKGGKLVTIWADELPSPCVVKGKSFDEASIQAALRRQNDSRAKTFAQQIMEHDGEEDEQLFVMIASHVGAPTWMTPVLDKFPVPTTRSTSPASTHSRSSSRSSNSSSCFSAASSGSSASTVSSQTSPVKQSRRERARQARVFVDTSKTDVTPYDGGKTTVLTGGVMLGGGKAKKAPQPIQASSNWRATRV